MYSMRCFMCLLLSGLPCWLCFSRDAGFTTFMAGMETPPLCRDREFGERRGGVKSGKVKAHTGTGRQAGAASAGHGMPGAVPSPPRHHRASSARTAHGGKAGQGGGHRLHVPKDIGELRNQPGLTHRHRRNANRESRGRQGKHRETEGRASPPGRGGHSREKGREATAGRSRFRVETAAVGEKRRFLSAICARMEIRKTCKSSREGSGTCTCVPWRCGSLKRCPHGSPRQCHTLRPPPCLGHPTSSPCLHRCLLPAPCRLWTGRCRQQNQQRRCCPGDVQVTAAGPG